MNTFELFYIRETLARADCPELVFGPAPITKAWQSLVQVCHPDKNIGPDESIASEAFVRLQEWKRIAELKIKAGTYGDRKPYRLIPEYKPTTIVVGKAKIELTSILGSGSFCDIHNSKTYYIKICRKPSDADLLAREFRNLNEIRRKSSNPKRESFFALTRHFFPVPVEMFSVQLQDGTKRKAILFLHSFNTNGITLTDLRNHFRGNVPLVHVYWIFRKILFGLCAAHERGIIHGAINPDHVIVFAKEHTIQIIDWSSSALIAKENVPTVDQKAFVPPEIFGKAKAHPTSDIFSAAQTCVWLAGGIDKFDPRIQESLKKCFLEPSKRPQDAGDYHDEFGKLIETVHGPRKYVELEI